MAVFAVSELARNILRRNALRYHMQDGRGSSCGSMAIELDLMLQGLLRVGDDARLYVTPEGHAWLVDDAQSERTGA